MGEYTDIVDIVAPSNAMAGERVDITVRIKNRWDYILLITADAIYNAIPFLHMDYWIPAGETHSFSSSFIMPNTDVTIHASSSYWLFGDVWELDDEAEKDVSLAEVLKGTISKKQLEHDGTYATIPVSNVPQDRRGLVHIWGRNDMSSAQRMGIIWVVKDPGGAVVEEHSEWEKWPYTSPGGEHHFIGGRFDLDKPGTWTIMVGLFISPEGSIAVDAYGGVLCTVKAAVPEPEFRDFGIEKYIAV
ncbi:hypothetical protein ES708_30265 [subsurface metagenome]